MSDFWNMEIPCIGKDYTAYGFNSINCEILKKTATLDVGSPHNFKQQPKQKMSYKFS